MILLVAAVLASASASASACPDGVSSKAIACRAVEASKIGKPDVAAQAFEQAALGAAANAPEAARLWAAAGNMWIAANQPGKAALALDRALAGTGLQAEQRGEALLDRARAAEAQSDLKTARAKANEAAQTIAGDPFLWYFSAALAIREGDAATAKLAINRALSLAPNDPTILFEAGHVAHFAGDPTSARAYWSQADRYDANGPIGKAARDAMNLLPPQPADGASGPPRKPVVQKGPGKTN